MTQPDKRISSSVPATSADAYTQALKSRLVAIPLLLSLITVLLFVVDLTIGSVSVSISDVVKALTGSDVDESIHTIVVDLRLCKAVMALMAGAALSVSGLQMQSIFHNPLAGPTVLGISSGASLAVAIFILGAPALGLSLSESASTLGIAGAAWIGASLILLIMLGVSRRIRDIMVVLILGMMLSSGISSIVQILQYISADNALKAFVVWTMGSLGSVTPEQIPIVAGALALGFLMAVPTVKPLNLLLLGENYASTLGVNIYATRFMVFTSTSLLAGTITAFCGPIGFIGLAMPHVARAMMNTANHRVLYPVSALCGAVVMLGCDIVSKSFTLPINAVTSMVGIPLIIWIVLRNK